MSAAKIMSELFGLYDWEKSAEMRKLWKSEAGKPFVLFYNPMDNTTKGDSAGTRFATFGLAIDSVFGHLDGHFAMSNCVHKFFIKLSEKESTYVRECVVKHVDPNRLCAWFTHDEIPGIYTIEFRPEV